MALLKALLDLIISMVCSQSSSDYYSKRIQKLIMGA